MAKESKAGKIVAGIVIALLTAGLATVTTLYIINLNTKCEKCETVNQDKDDSKNKEKSYEGPDLLDDDKDEDEDEDEGDDNEEDETPVSTKNVKPDDLEKPDVSGYSIKEACKAVRKAGWRVNRIYDSKYSDNYSCADEGTVTRTYYYSIENKVELYFK